MCARDPNGDRTRVSRALATFLLHTYIYLYLRSGMGEILEKKNKCTIFFTNRCTHDVTKTIIITLLR